jgi:hypothetical protein
MRSRILAPTAASNSSFVGFWVDFRRSSR